MAQSNLNQQLNQALGTAAAFAQTASLIDKTKKTEDDLADVAADLSGTKDTEAISKISTNTDEEFGSYNKYINAYNREASYKSKSFYYNKQKNMYTNAGYNLGELRLSRYKLDTEIQAVNALKAELQANIDDPKSANISNLHKYVSALKKRGLPDIESFKKED